MTKYLWKNNKISFVIVCFLAILVSLAGIVASQYIGATVNTLVYVEEGSVNVMSIFLEIALLLTSIMVVMFVYDFVRARYDANLYKKIEKDLAKKLILKVQSISDVTNIYNQEIRTVIDNFLIVIRGLFVVVLQFIFAIVLGASISWQFVVGMIIVATTSFIVSHLFSKKLSKRALELQEKNANMNRMVNGIFSAIRTINIYSSKVFAISKLELMFEEKRIANIRNKDINVYATVINNFFAYFIQVGFTVGAYILVYWGHIKIGQAVVLYLISSYISQGIFNIMHYKNTIDSTKEIRKKLENILNEPYDEQITSINTGDIIFNNLSFSYTEEEFIKDLNIDFKNNKKYLIVGASGSGKSTLLKLILKELNPNAGSINYSGINISEFNMPTWYQNISYAGQKVEIIPGSLRENIILGKEYDEKRFNYIIGLLNLNYLVPKLDDVLHEDLSNFSGGELQRITIARMLYKDSPIFIFDEFSSALDNMNAYQIEKEILKIENKLLVSVTHRVQLDLIEQYEKIIIMESGKIKHIGSASELINELQGFLFGDAKPL